MKRSVAGDSERPVTMRPDQHATPAHSSNPLDFVHSYTFHIHHAGSLRRISPAPSIQAPTRVFSRLAQLRPA